MKFRSTKARATAREGPVPLTRAAFRLLLNFRFDISFARLSKPACDFQTIQSLAKRHSKLQQAITAYRRSVACLEDLPFAYVKQKQRGSPGELCGL